jgi:VanZ family protein
MKACAAYFRMLKRVAGTVWVVVIFMASVFPLDNITISSDALIAHSDKIVHFLMYFILEVLLIYQLDAFSNSKKIGCIFIFSVVYGFILEIVQLFFLTNRFFEIFDLIANITGALTGILFIYLIKT